ncbi:MAG: hypothetical protein HRU19_11195 [Pseudobacteriovorax sp.]|nr:hypothetical protein [Pseudobacteriovorax sp.]
MRQILTLLFLFSLSRPAYGATFVGNGGSFLDPELSATLHQLEEILSQISGKEDLSKCYVRECEVLESLSWDELDFADAFFISRKDKILKKLQQRELTFVWTRDDIKLHGVNHRSFSAVAHKNRITLNEKIFARLNRAQRLTLVLHEIHHTIPYKGSILRDDMAIGPFKSKEGARRLLDIQGPLLIAAASKSKYWQRNRVESSNPVSKVMLSFRTGNVFLNETEMNRIFLDEVLLRQLGIEFFPWSNSNWGYSLGYKEFVGDSSGPFKSDIKGTQIDLGLSHRSRITSLFTKQSSSESIISSGYWDRILLKWNVSIGSGSMKHRISDNFNRIEGKSDYYSLGSKAEIIIPAIKGFWFGAGLGAQYQDYLIDETNFSSKSLYKDVFFTVGYGAN